MRDINTLTLYLLLLVYAPISSYVSENVFSIIGLLGFFRSYVKEWGYPVVNVLATDPRYQRFQALMTILRSIKEFSECYKRC